jgi:uncharacterized protein YggE
MDNSTLFVVVFLLIVLFVVFLNSSEDLSDVTFDLSETGMVKVVNDQMRIQASVESELNPKADDSYKQIMGTVSHIKKMLDENNQVKNLKIQTSTQPEYDFKKEGGRELKGYRARSDISFDVAVKGKEQTLRAGEIQNRLSSASKSNKVKVLIDSTSYSVSDSYRAELEGVALRNAIQKAKAQARVLVNNTYPGRDFKVVSVAIRESSRYGPVFAQARSLEAASAPKDIVAQGGSTVSVTIDMKVGVM